MGLNRSQTIRMKFYYYSNIICFFIDLKNNETAIFFHKLLNICVSFPSMDPSESSKFQVFFLSDEKKRNLHKICYKSSWKFSTFYKFVSTTVNEPYIFKIRSIEKESFVLDTYEREKRIWTRCRFWFWNHSNHTLV